MAAAAEARKRSEDDYDLLMKARQAAEGVPLCSSCLSCWDGGEGRSRAVALLGGLGAGEGQAGCCVLGETCCLWSTTAL